MSLIVKQDENGDFEPVPAGNCQAICYAVIDIGTHYNPVFNKSLHQVILTWEIPQYRIEIEKDGVKKNLPRAISKTYTLSLHEKSNLYHDLTSWRGRDFTDEELEAFDLKQVAGSNCILNVVHKTTTQGRTFAKVAAVTPIMQAVMKPLKPENPIVTYDMDDDGFDIPKTIPDWVKTKIRASNEFNEQGHPDKIKDEDIPF